MFCVQRPLGIMTQKPQKQSLGCAFLHSTAKCSSSVISTENRTLYVTMNLLRNALRGRMVHTRLSGCRVQGREFRQECLLPSCAVDPSSVSCSTPNGIGRPGGRLFQGKLYPDYVGQSLTVAAKAPGAFVELQTAWPKLPDPRHRGLL